MDLRFTLIGVIIGFLIGLTGMGGGSLMTPVMILVMGVKPIVAVGTDLAYGAVTKIIGGGAHLRMGTVHRKSAYLLGVGSIPATIAGVGLVAAVRHAHPQLVNVFLLHAIAWVLIMVGVFLALKPFLVALANRRKERELGVDFRDGLQSLGDTHPWVLPLIGAFAGFLVGLTSVGSGTIVIAALLFLYPRWESKELVGTDVFHAAMLVSAASLAQLAAGNVNIPMMLSLLLGSVPGVLIGSRMAVGFSERYLRLGMASVLLLSGAKLL